MNDNYLQSIKKIFQYYHSLGLKTMDQLQDEHLFFSPNKTCNSIAVIVKHLHGNMMSRWTDFLTTDGEKDLRDRDGEFESSFYLRSEVYSKYQEGWNCLFQTIESLDAYDLEKTIYIRNQGHTVLEAINRQLAHVPYHIGQIVYIGKLSQDQEWESLSIPKGKSKEFNATHFNKPKHKAHYTDEFLEDKE